MSGSDPDWFARCIALAGLAIAIVSLGWQMYQHLRERAKVVAELDGRFIVGLEVPAEADA